MKSIAFAILIVGIMHMKAESPRAGQVLAALWIICVFGFLVSLPL